MLLTPRVSRRKLAASFGIALLTTSCGDGSSATSAAGSDSRHGARAAATPDAGATVGPVLDAPGVQGANGPAVVEQPPPEAVDAAAAEPQSDAGAMPTPIAEVVVPVPTPSPSSEPPPAPASADPGNSPPFDIDAGTRQIDIDAGASQDPASGSEAPSAAEGFSIELVFEDESSIAPAVRDAFEAARSRWETVIVGDLPDVYLSQSATCDGHALPATVDDVILFVTVSDLDGPDGLLGAAGPCAIRSRAPRLPFAAAMDFDSADLDAFAQAGRLEEIVLHEMGHALGIGSLWEGLGLVDDPSDGSGDADTAFNGPAARQAFDDVGGDAYLDGNKVPVENRGTEGEINGHWRESVLGNELMTTRMGATRAALSVVTIASLQDMGYQVDAAAADDYSWPASDGAFALRVIGPPVAPLEADFGDDLLRLPLYEVTKDGLLLPVGSASPTPAMP